MLKSYNGVMVDNHLDHLAMKDYNVHIGRIKSRKTCG
jgi:hypothetical protein